VHLKKIDSNIGVKFLSGLLPFQGQARLVLQGWIFPQAVGDGYQALSGSLTRAPAVRTPRTPPYASPPESLEAIEELVEAARLKSAQLIIFIPPWTNEPNHALQAQYANVMADIRPRLRQKRICDLSSASSPELDQLAMDMANFWDRQHLNGDGAVRFTRLFARLISEHCRS
jgi:hypothetical protein